MSDEKVVTAEDLDNALNADGFSEESKEKLGEVIENAQEKAEDIKENLQEVEKKLEDEDDNTEKTRLGRKVKILQEQFGELNSKIDQLIALQTKTPESLDTEVDGFDTDLEIPLSKSDLEKLLPEILEKNEKKKIETKQNYEKVFVGEILNNLGKNLTEKQHKEVEDILLSNYNEIITGDPKVDALINFTKAERDWAALGKGSKKVALLKDTPPAHDKDEDGEKIEVSNLMSKLDPAAREYAEKVGLSAKDIKKALGIK